MSLRPFLVIVLFGALAGGCGSKVSEANYYRVQHGMTEEDVDDLLGPSKEDLATPAAPTTQSTARKIKTWTRGRLTIRVAFENGVVVSRSADGIAFEGDSRPATAPTST